MIASLPMYDRPETQAANDRLWTAIRDAAGHGPKALTRNEDLWSQWTSPKLFLSQTCGLPIASSLGDKVQLIGTPIFDLPCPAGHYFSVLVARTSDPREGIADFANARAAINGYDSQSGWGALWKVLQDQSITLDVSVTGSHRASAQAIATGDADIAAIDAVTWRMIQRWDQSAAKLRVIGQTQPTVTLPYITSLNHDADMLRRAMTDAIQSLSADDRDTLCLTGLTRLQTEQYLALPIPPQPCLSL